MYIISKFHDFYDRAMVYGIDKECVYNRDQVEIKLDKLKNQLPYPKVVEYPRFKLIASPSILGFCGNIYPLITVTFDGLDEKPNHFYSSEECIDFLEFRGFLLDKGKKWYSLFGRGDLRYEKGIRDFFNNDFKKMESIFIEYKTPIFNVTNKESNSILTINPRLESMHFMKVKDPATAFQDIYMYKSGVLCNTDKNTLEISDKVKL